MGRRVHTYYVYIMSNVRNRRGTLYTGVTNNIVRRVIQHREKTNEAAFTSRYNLRYLVYVEEYQYVLDAIAREKQIKGWLREKKIAMIEELNPEWQDLAADWYE